MGELGLTTGIVLAAGAGTRMGRPKGLVRRADGVPWVELAVRALRDGGCAPVLVVVGAQADDVAGLVPADVTVVRADDWATGMSASLRVGLLAAAGDTAIVTLVDTPGVTAEAVARLAALAAAGSLARAAYDGVPGHPVLIGRTHHDGILATLTGDAGARTYLRAHPHALVECADIADGTDIDTP